MTPIENGHQLHFVAPVTIAQLVEVKAAIKAGHPPGTRVELVIEPCGSVVAVEILKPDAPPYRARYAVPVPEAAP